jgi:hypothetical protein
MHRRMRFEGSKADNKADRNLAKEVGLTKAQFEATPADKLHDQIGQAANNRLANKRIAGKVVASEPKERGGRGSARARGATAPHRFAFRQPHVG